jgi:hypothetical protein
LQERAWSVDQKTPRMVPKNCSGGRIPCSLLAVPRYPAPSKKNLWLGIQKFPAPLRREFGCKPLYSLAEWSQKLANQPKILKIPCKFPVSRELQTGDRFVSDCAHHHPVLPNCRFPGRLKAGRFCGIFADIVSALSVSGDTRGLSGRFQPPVSASKNSVPPRQGFDGQYRLAVR